MRFNIAEVNNAQYVSTLYQTLCSARSTCLVIALNKFVVGSLHETEGQSMQRIFIHFVQKIRNTMACGCGQIHIINEWKCPGCNCGAINVLYIQNGRIQVSPKQELMKKFKQQQPQEHKGKKNKNLAPKRSQQSPLSKTSSSHAHCSTSCDLLPGPSPKQDTLLTIKAQEITSATSAKLKNDRLIVHDDGCAADLEIEIDASASPSPSCSSADAQSCPSNHELCRQAEQKALGRLFCMIMELESKSTSTGLGSS